MGNQAVGDTISVLPEDRKLAIRVKEYGNGIAGLSYEVRNLSMDRLIEKTEVEDWQAEGGRYPGGASYSESADPE